MQKRKRKQELYLILKERGVSGAKHFCPIELKLFPRKVWSGHDNMLVTGHIPVLLYTNGT